MTNRSKYLATATIPKSVMFRPFRDIAAELGVMTIKSNEHKGCKIGPRVPAERIWGSASTDRSIKKSYNQSRFAYFAEAAEELRIGANTCLTSHSRNSTAGLDRTDRPVYSDNRGKDITCHIDSGKNYE